MMMRRNRVVVSCIIILLVLALVWFTGPVSAQDSPLVVQIDWPNEGETLYAGPSSLLYSVPVEGHVQGVEQVDEPVTVRLEIVQHGVTVAEHVQLLQEGGTFSFNVTVNPNASQGQFTAEQSGCIAACHFASELTFPAGPVLLRASVVSPAAIPAVPAERRITVDRSSLALIPVRVVLDDASHSAVSGVQVSAATRLYLWRTRHELAATNTDGIAHLQVEALREAPTTYALYVQPTVIDGVLYESSAYEGIEVTLPPAARSTAPVTLSVTARQGHISGKLLPAGADPRPDSVWAICLPDGESFQTQVNQDAGFQFSPLPVDQFLLALDPAWLAAHGRRSAGVLLNLEEAPSTEVDLSLEPVGTMMLSGRVVTAEGEPLPFAWVREEGDGQEVPVLPVDGRYALPFRPEAATTMIVTAPGFYSRAALIDPDPAGGELTVALTPRPETEALEWGNGAVVLPEDSHTRMADGRIFLEYGWLWGENEAGEALIIQAGEIAIALMHGRFALDFRPPARGWLYLPEGEAVITDGQGREVDVSAGQMVNLLNDEGLKVVAYEPVAFAVLGVEDTSPLPAVWEPSVQAQLRDRMALIGVGVAQLVTYVTYFLLLLSLLVVPLAVLYFRWKGRQKAVFLSMDRGE